MTESGKDGRKAQLSISEGAPLDLPILGATEGNEGIGIGALRKETGAVTYDPGFMNTANRVIGVVVQVVKSGDCGGMIPSTASDSGAQLRRLQLALRT